jgi:hypothetical protein
MSVGEREELEAVVAARAELGSDYEPVLADSFLERLEKQAALRGKSVSRAREHRTVTPLILGSLAIAIPLMAVAGSAAGLAGVALVCAAIVIVNVVAMRR